jgi:hypothetical protein
MIRGHTEVTGTKGIGLGAHFKETPVVFSTIKLAQDLIGKYDYQMFDGIIIAAALEAGCDILYSEISAIRTSWIHIPVPNSVTGDIFLLWEPEC